eukprot:GHVU01212256.1.p1 GENE.GHVU01212256.1~~GHVU01212256.1.p1  ORF type:complete len:715 (+),score=82.31 GHVU01212256.1:162-2147(+)
MNVPAAQRLLEGIAKAEAASSGVGVAAAVCPFPILQRICEDFLAPLSVTLDLTAQLTMASRLAHLFFFLFNDKGIRFVPGYLYHDVQATVKAFFVLAARGQGWSDTFQLHLHQVGTDSQEETHALVRTCSHKSNVSTLDLQTNLTIVTQVSEILTKHPDWTPPDVRRSCPEDSDRVRARYVPTDVSRVCADVDLWECWAAGRKGAQTTLSQGEFFSKEEVEVGFSGVQAQGGSLLCPYGRTVGIRKVAANAITEEEEEEEEVREEQEDQEEGDEDLPELALMLPQEMYDDCDGQVTHVEADGVSIHKRRYVRQQCALQPLSRDRLRRIARTPKFEECAAFAAFGDDDEEIHARDFVAHLATADTCVSIIVATVVRLTVARKPVWAVAKGRLNDAVQVHAQALPLRLEDGGKFVWRRSGAGPTPAGRSHTLRGDKVQSLSPDIVVEGGQMRFEFDCEALQLVCENLWAQQRGTFHRDRPLIPGVERECLPLTPEGGVGVSVEEAVPAATGTGDDVVQCELCDIWVGRQDLRRHVGHHILCGNGVTHRVDTCGFCGESGYCTVGLTAKTSRAVARPLSSCLLFYPFRYGAAASEKKCTNVPVYCPECVEEKRDPQVFWKYNMGLHWSEMHAELPFPAEFQYDEAAEIGAIERARLWWFSCKSN